MYRILIAFRHKNNIRVLLPKGILIDLCTRNFVYAITSLRACCMHARHCTRNLSSPVSHVFILAPNTYKKNTRFASHGLLTKPTSNTSKYGTNDFAASAIASWNFFYKSHSQTTPSSEQR